MAVEAYYGAETVWVSEFDKYASKVIEARINKPNLGNLKVINWAKSRFSFEMDKERVPTPLDQGKLNVKFVEYMMGLPDGWVTDMDISRAQMLKILGNGVVPQQAYRALELLNNVK